MRDGGGRRGKRDGGDGGKRSEVPFQEISNQWKAERALEIILERGRAPIYIKTGTERGLRKRKGRR